eukprot:CAMPEP_0119355238 /NCGR_PEP_ID=MMETSP1334-20130426/4093_1 /TAXON_ID=127549 /ORGANISM="Calcidiscus leptoporus, Strain RCC1130" /LENGTH=84 /DNA_ID=CAMNT_0007368997 /DNA_START=14 /DNA_END=265 /DNA_ORIENTATION=+
MQRLSIASLSLLVALASTRDTGMDREGKKRRPEYPDKEVVECKMADVLDGSFDACTALVAIFDRLPAKHMAALMDGVSRHKRLQ